MILSQKGVLSAGYVLPNILVWIVGAGIISHDAKAGVLLLIFCRPVTRLQYVLSKWIALSAIVTAVYLICTLYALGAHVDIITGGSAENILHGVIMGVSVCLAASAVVVLISSVPFGFGDLGFLAVSWTLVLIVQLVDKEFNLAPILSGFLFPKFDLKAGSLLSAAAGFQLLGHLAIIVISLSTSTLLLKKKELTYADS